MPRLLVVHHTPSPSLHAMFDAVRSGASDPHLGGVEVVTRAALTASPVDVLEADGYVVGGPANLGYMAGALKHFFDTTYYPCLDQTVGRPFAAYLHGNDDTAGARRALEAITTGLRWKPVAEVAEVRGEPDGAALDACWNLGAVVGASLIAG